MRCLYTFYNRYEASETEKYRNQRNHIITTKIECPEGLQFVVGCQTAEGHVEDQLVNGRAQFGCNQLESQIEIIHRHRNSAYIFNQSYRQRIADCHRVVLILIGKIKLLFMNSALIRNQNFIESSSTVLQLQVVIVNKDAINEQSFANNFIIVSILQRGVKNGGETGREIL